MGSFGLEDKKIYQIENIDIDIITISRSLIILGMDRNQIEIIRLQCFDDHLLNIEIVSRAFLDFLRDLEEPVITYWLYKPFRKSTSEYFHYFIK